MQRLLDGSRHDTRWLRWRPATGVCERHLESVVAGLEIGRVEPELATFVSRAFLGSASSIAVVALAVISFRRYPRFNDLLGLLGVALVKNLGYRQLTT